MALHIKNAAVERLASDVARLADEPLLFVGSDFPRTDIARP